MRRGLLIAALAVALLGCARQGSEPTARKEEAPPAAAAPAAVPARPPPGRALTTGERELLRPLFRDGLDYDAVRVIPERFIPFQPSNVYMTPEGNIFAPGDLYRADFAADANPYLRAVFVHECLHVWQYQSGMNLLAAGVREFLKGGGAYEEAYPYTLQAERDLLDYGMEQQASIVEDYHLITAYQLGPGRLRNPALTPAERAALYARVLAQFLGDPRYARALAAAAVVARHEALSREGPAGTSGCDEKIEPPAVAHMCHWRFEPH